MKFFTPKWIDDLTKGIRKSLEERNIFAEIMKQKDEVLDSFSKAYVAETGLKPSQVVMCVEHHVEGEKFIQHIWFEKKKW